MTNILHYEVDSKFVDRCEEINSAEHNETMSEMIGTYDDGCYIYFDAFDKKDGGYCQYVLYDKEGHELGFTDPLNEDEVIDEFELDDNHKLIVKVREIEESLKEEYKEDDLIDLGEDEVPMTFGELVEIMENRLLREDTLVENLEEVAIKYAKDFIKENNGTKIKKEAKR